jgi:hypothetical protein
MSFSVCEVFEIVYIELPVRKDVSFSGSVRHAGSEGWLEWRFWQQRRQELLE